MCRLLVLLLFVSSTHAQEDEEESKASINPAILYKTYCANCHGVNMEGAQHAPLIKDVWLYGRDRTHMLRNLMYGIANTDMISWAQVIGDAECESLIDYIIESQDRPPTEIKTFPTVLHTEDYDLQVEALVEDGFRTAPWGIEFVDDRRALITERREGLRWMVDGVLDPEPIHGIPVATHYGDSGMFDLALHPDYSTNGRVYISYVHPLGDPDSRDTPAMTRVIRGRVNGHQWVDQETIFKVDEKLHISPGRGPWGSRMLFDKDGYLLFSIGDSTKLDHVQLLSRPSGKVFRVFADGMIPEDNPFVGYEGAFEAIYAIGNRNIQGMDQHPLTGDYWTTEHGPMGGDELNVIEKGKNYGWPVITHGRDYTGEPISLLTHREGMEQPVKYWVPSPALCPLEFYTGNLFPKWKNHALLGALKFEEVRRVVIQGVEVVSEEVILKGYGRVRDVKFGPDGALYLCINRPELIVRLTPMSH
ncbi:MAG: PQQ-dependent sugar dehydrogenase [Verrucomicrobia bacterium]|nr:PQQ-dependent sugar dehydrogenase [Verrucomicrobiota bacterium]MDA1065736.1 PQQ-dependent sugar dehydrogenase [Verrucomicrobiota bacterium]